MVVYYDANALMLRPLDDNAFVMGNRAGAASPRAKGGYWPFPDTGGRGRKS